MVKIASLQQEGIRPLTTSSFLVCLLIVAFWSLGKTGLSGEPARIPRCCPVAIYAQRTQQRLKEQCL